MRRFIFLLLLSQISLAQNATVILSMNEGVDTAASNGTLPNRDAYTNCATSCSGGTPSPSPYGELWCNASQITTCGSFGTSAVTSSITGVGTHALDNGLGAGGVNSATNVTITYAQSIVHGCPVGTNNPSGISGLNLPGETPSGHESFNMHAGGSGVSNTSILAPTKIRNVTNGDNALNWVEEGCIQINTTSVAGQHSEADVNYTATDGTYDGLGWDYDHVHGYHRTAPQAQPWHEVKYQDVNTGIVSTTMPFPANHWIYYTKWMHLNPNCKSTSSSNCFFYDKWCQQDFTAGGTYNCWYLIDATTNQVPGGIPVLRTSFTRNEATTQTQIESTGASANITITYDFKNLVMYSLSVTNSYPTKLGPSPL